MGFKKTVISTLFISMISSLSAENLNEVLDLVDNSLKMKIEDQNVKISKKSEDVAFGENLFQVNLGYSATHLTQTPEAFDSDAGLLEPSGQKKDSYIGSASLVYPIFTGFSGIRNIEKNKLSTMQQQLSYSNAKREYYMNAIDLYSQIYTAKYQIISLQSALKANEDALKKAQEFYNAGLAPISDLSNIKAEYYQTKADLLNAKTQTFSIFAFIALIVAFKYGK